MNMASNDSGVAVAAAAVNAGTPGQEATQANHNAAPSSTTTKEVIATSPVSTDVSSSVTKDVPKTESAIAPSSGNTTTTPPPSIPSSNTAETAVSSSSSSSSSQSADAKPSEDHDKNSSPTTTAKTTVDAAVTNTSTSAECKKEDSSEKKEGKEPEQVDKKTDQQTLTPAVEASKANTDVKDKQAATATNESPSSSGDNKTSSAEKSSVSGSEAGKPTIAPQSATPTSTKIESPLAEVSTNIKTKPSTTTAPVPPRPVATIKPMVESSTAASNNNPTTPIDTSASKSNSSSSNPKSSNKRPAEDTEESSSSDKKIKSSSTPSSSSSDGQKEGNKKAKEVLEYMDKTFDHRRKIITKQMPTIPELKSMYPELFMCKQLLLEFQRITKIDIDQKIQEFCVRYATAVIEMARSNKAAAPVLARWEKAKQENETLKQYWDMVTALCLLPLHFGENFVEMVLEIGEDEEVKAQGKIVPTLVARGNIFRTDEFFLIAENTIVQEFEEFTIAFASLYSSYWVFNMVYPETIENTYNYIQRCIVRQREPGAISTVCKNFTKSLQKWNKEKEGK